jgi:hypothetical protein
LRPDCGADPYRSRLHYITNFKLFWKKRIKLTSFNGVTQFDLRGITENSAHSSQREWIKPRRTTWNIFKTDKSERRKDYGATYTGGNDWPVSCLLLDNVPRLFTHIYTDADGRWEGNINTRRPDEEFHPFHLCNIVQYNDNNNNCCRRAIQLARLARCSHDDASVRPTTQNRPLSKKGQPARARAIILESTLLLLLYNNIFLWRKR